MLKFVDISKDNPKKTSSKERRKNFSENQLLENIKSIFSNLKKEKSAIFNGENIKKIYLSSSMGPSFKLNFKDI